MAKIKHALSPGSFGPFRSFALIIVFGFSISIADRRVDGATGAYLIVVAILEFPSVARCAN
jgi:hypothetical protein